MSSSSETRQDGTNVQAPTQSWRVHGDNTASAGISLEALREAKAAAYLEYRTIEDAIRRRHEEVGAEFADKRKAAQESCAKANEELQAELGRLAVEEVMKDLPYPEGTVLHEWKRYPYPDCPWVQTGTKGVLQVFRPGDPEPKKWNWNAPQPGHIIVRLLKKDGTLGLRIGKSDPWWREEATVAWLPEGEAPVPELSVSK